MAGPLHGVRVVEFEGIGPAPFGCMMLADNGARVIRIARPISPGSGMVDEHRDVLGRSREVVRLDLRTADARARALDLAASADVVVEGFRPGVMERMGLGPDTLLAARPSLVYARMTGWGQSGPLAPMAGHDINYIALSGALDACGRAGERPTPPVNFLADFGGGGMLLAFGVVSALLHARATGHGQVVDCAMLDGSAALTAMLWSFRAAGTWRDERGTNVLDTGAHFYECYETADRRYVALGAIEPQFYARLLAALGMEDDAELRVQMDRAGWPALKARLEAIFRTRTREEWCRRLEGVDCCFAPILSSGEATLHPHNRARGVFVTVDGVVQPAPAPRYSHTPNDMPRMRSSGMSPEAPDTDLECRAR